LPFPVLRFPAAPLLAALLLLPLPALATLGGDASTPQADQLHMKAALRVSQRARYAVHEIALPYGTTAREYVSPQGVVFAVAWEGPVKPDLRQLLGAYYELYVQAPPNTRGAHNAAVIVLPELVVHSMGHLRAFSGRAYLRSQMPDGVSVGELK
jgi:uncharacterized protein DUF2844